LIPVAVALAELVADAAVLADAVVLAAALELELLELELHAAMVDTAATAAKASTAGLRTAMNVALL
jgi:hypothetical protein